jgi:hypothetical protein
MDKSKVERAVLYGMTKAEHTFRDAPAQDSS